MAMENAKCPKCGKDAPLYRNDEGERVASRSAWRAGPAATRFNVKLSN